MSSARGKTFDVVYVCRLYKGTVFKEKRNLKASPACCEQDLNNQDFEQKATKETKGKGPAEFGGCTKHCKGLALVWVGLASLDPRYESVNRVASLIGQPRTLSIG